MQNFLSRAALMLLLLGSFGLAACNTTEGIGEDVQATGEAIEESASEVKQEL